MTGHTIHTAYWQKPGPERAWDWSAYFDDYDGALDARHPQGYGPTELYAIADLLQQERERLEASSKPQTSDACEELCGICARHYGRCQKPNGSSAALERSRDVNKEEK